MTRPRGTIRQALASAAWDLHVRRGDEQRGFHWRELMGACDLGLSMSAREQVSVVKRTVVNMAAAGELVPVGTVRTPHACRPMVLYEPGGLGASSNGVAELLDAMHSWRDFK